MAGANVKLVGVGGGLAYGYLGPTHHAIEDLALMRALPGMTVLAPGDPAEALRATRAAFALDGPVYLRLGKNGEPPLLPAGRPVRGRARATLRDGADVTLASTGAILAEALDAADLLAAAGIEAARPPLRHGQAVRRRDAARPPRSRAPSSRVEEHSILGGLGSAAAEALAEAGVPARLRRSGCPTRSRTRSARASTCSRHYGLDAAEIAAAALELLELDRPRSLA